MDKLKKYGFTNPLSLIGIDSFDADYLRRVANKLVIQVKEDLYEENKTVYKDLQSKLEQLNLLKEGLEGNELDRCKQQISKISREIKDIRTHREKWYKDLDRITGIIHGTDDISILIYHIVDLNSAHLRFGGSREEDMSQEQIQYKRVSSDLSASFKNYYDVAKFLNETVNVKQNIDYKNANLSQYEFLGNKNDKKGLPYYVCAVRGIDEPIKILDGVDFNGEKIKAYKIGYFMFGTPNIPRNGSNTIPKKFEGQTSKKYDVLSIIKKGINGKVKTYNGIMYINEDIKKDMYFWKNIVFSDCVLENAMDNNFGYIGSVENKNGKRKLKFKDPIEIIGDHAEVRALSYMQKYGGRFYGLSEPCNNLNEFYEIMNNKVKMLSKIGKNPQIPNNSEGR